VSSVVHALSVVIGCAFVVGPVWFLARRQRVCWQCAENHARDVMLEKQRCVVELRPSTFFSDRTGAIRVTSAGKVLTASLDFDDQPQASSWLDENTMNKADEEDVKYAHNAYLSFKRRRALAPWWRRRWVR